ncbi:MAG TPA: presqualene diphosphate synthase HpnD [Verrucomicrobiota bacterium]|nr:MAG: All-trans-phytoene synthase [Verrucomicrobia bacterium ADurb.Bin118]HPY30863.1 presqualene diphosphate synthase HpnD [Verrucomicrobiota bacterium]HQB17237.1 presqualene diphosphate synthase HpnD [Verrucomicrobiota bacterium]
MQQSRAITRRSASNLALAFCLLPRPRRHAMCALYAFCREVDDVADDPAVPVEQRRTQLAIWRDDLRRACTGGATTLPVIRELQPVIREYHLPFALLDEILQGCEMDLEKSRYADSAELELYCYRVAAAVGLLSIRIFGARHPQSADYAVQLGHALQWTNILRDVWEDAQRGRIYLPLDMLHHFQVTEAEILGGTYSSRYRALAAVAAAEAKRHYQRARELLPAEDRPVMVAAELMGAVYWRLLRKLEQRQFNVFVPDRVRLSRLHKLGLIMGAWWRHRLGAKTSAYGTS